MDVRPVPGQPVLHVGRNPWRRTWPPRPQLVGEGEEARPLDALAEHVERVGAPRLLRGGQHAHQEAVVLDGLEVADGDQVARGGR